MNKLDQAVIELFKQYHKELKPHLIVLEAKIEFFPEGILNEIRALFDHCARMVLPGISEQDKIEEIDSAKRHIYRAAFDCFKELCVHYDIELENFQKNYKKIRLGEVDSGRFQTKYLDLKTEAEKLVREAKSFEKHGRSKYKEASDKFQDAILAYERISEFIIDSKKNLEWSVSQQKRYSLKSHIITAVITVIVTVIMFWLKSIIGFQ